MNAEEYLRQIQKLEHVIHCDEERAKEYDRRSYAIPGPVYDRERVDHTPSLDAPFVKWITKKLDIEERIQKEIEFLERFRAEAMAQVEELEDPDEKNVLVYRYFSHMNWEDIIKKMHYSERTVMRKHKSALANLKVPEDSILFKPKVGS